MKAMLWVWGDIVYLEDTTGKAGQLEFNQNIERSACQTKTEMGSERTKESLVISEQRNKFQVSCSGED